VLPDFTVAEWVLAGIAALGIGISKSGLPGLSLLHVVVFAQLFPGTASTGVVLPMLIVGDVGAVLLFRRMADWKHVGRTLPPALVGVVVGWALLRSTAGTSFAGTGFGPVVGGILLVLATLQLLRDWKPDAFASVPHTVLFAWGMGLLAGVTTMVANAAGPVMVLYFLAVALPKETLVGTSAWFFLLINVFKLPFGAQLGLIHRDSLTINALLIPAIVAGLVLGKTLIRRIPQRGFNAIILTLVVLAALRLSGLFRWP
jgi:uncharacterized protein